MDLSEIPTPDLLMELQRRCSIAENHVSLTPEWATPVLILVAEFEGMTLRQLMHVANRTDEASLRRHMAMTLLRGTMPKRSFAEIGALWNQNHATVVNAVRRIDAEVVTNPAFRLRWESLVHLATERGLCRSARQPVSADAAPAA